MKSFFASIALAAVSSSGFCKEPAAPAQETGAPPKYTVEQAAEHAGELVTIEGIVTSVRTSTSGNLYVNFGGEYPNHVFSAFVRRGNVDKVPGLDGAGGRTMRVTGAVEIYQNKPQIEVKSADQVEIDEEKAPAES